MGALAVMCSRLAAGDAAPRHVHGHEHEILRMLDGDAVVWGARNGTRSGGFEGFFRSGDHDLSLPKPEGWAMSPPGAGRGDGDHGGQIVGPPPGPTD